MSRDQAQLYCEEQGGELAKINNQTVYNFARLHTETGCKPISTIQSAIYWLIYENMNIIWCIIAYWIDGRDKIDEYRFELTYSCSFTGSLNFYGIPTEILPTSCLSLVRGRSAATSKLQAVNCNEERVPFCQYPMNGCDNEEPPPFSYVLP